MFNQQQPPQQPQNSLFTQQPLTPTQQPLNPQNSLFTQQPLTPTQPLQPQLSMPLNPTPMYPTQQPLNPTQQPLNPTQTPMFPNQANPFTSNPFGGVQQGRPPSQQMGNNQSNLFDPFAQLGQTNPTPANQGNSLAPPPSGAPRRGRRGTGTPGNSGSSGNSDFDPFAM
eukprot:TRINITY_DN6230_c0_g1_i1.p1 TRINITY_DN6230_c0_g1~~TRINITY_DN6230_c0_g1_i1.p1  ORF type:complete len:176 (+),score=37.74 TRINITY_DN6230_c0_g1_i1:22-528(+)